MQRGSMESDKLRNCYIVEGKTDEDKVKRLGGRLVVKTGGKYISENTLKLILLISQKRRIVTVTDPDGPGKKIRERIQSLVGTEHCSSVRTKISDSFDGKKIGIAQTDLTILREAMEKYLEQDSTSTEVPSFTPADMMVLQLTGEGAKARREKIEKHLGVTFPDAKTFAEGMECLRITREDIEEILKDVR